MPDPLPVTEGELELLESEITDFITELLEKRKIRYLKCRRAHESRSISASLNREAGGEGTVHPAMERNQLERSCKDRGWTVVAEYVEPGASATDDRRPQFQRMMEDATRPDRPFDAVLVHSFSCFFRELFPVRNAPPHAGEDRMSP